MDKTAETKAELRDRIKRLEAINERLRSQIPSSSRRKLLRGLAVASVGALSLSAASGTAAAAPSGTFPVETDEPLLKTRVDRVRFVTRGDLPSTPNTGRVITYVDGGDLP